MTWRERGPIPGIFITREPDTRGNLVCDGTNDQVEFNEAIDRIDDRGWNGGAIWVGPGTYTIESSITITDLSCQIIGLGGTGYTDVPTANPVAMLQAGSSLSDWVIKYQNNDATLNPVIDNLVIDGDSKTGPLGGIWLNDTQLARISNCFIDDFHKTSGDGGTGILLDGGDGGPTSHYYNLLENNTIRRCTRGLRLKDASNANTIIGGYIDGGSGAGPSTKYGVWGTGTSIFVGSTRMFGLTIANFTNSTDIAFYIDYQSRSWQVFGLVLDNNYGNIKIDSGNYDHIFVGGTCENVVSGGTAWDDSGPRNHVIWNKDIIMTKRETSGTFSVASTGRKTWSITHGLDYTPDENEVSCTVLQETSVTDYYTSAPRVLSCNSTTVSGDIYVINASATGGATARIGAWMCKARW